MDVYLVGPGGIRTEKLETLAIELAIAQGIDPSVAKDLLEYSGPPEGQQGGSVCSMENALFAMAQENWVPTYI